MFNNRVTYRAMLERKVRRIININNNNKNKSIHIIQIEIVDDYCCCLRHHHSVFQKYHSASMNHSELNKSICSNVVCLQMFPDWLILSIMNMRYAIIILHRESFNTYRIISSYLYHMSSTVFFNGFHHLSNCSSSSSSSSSIVNRQSSIVNHQSSIVNRQSAIIKRQASIMDHQSSIVNHQSSTPSSLSLPSTILH